MASPSAAQAAALSRTPLELRRLPAGIAALFGCALLALGAHGALARLGRPFPGFFAWDNGVLVALHGSDWSGPRAGLPQNGGVIVAIDGRPFAGAKTWLDAIAARTSTAPVRYSVRVGGSVREFAVRPMPFSLWRFAESLGIYLVSATALLGVAVLALALRPDAPEARALSAVLFSMGAAGALTVDLVTAGRAAPLCAAFEALTLPALVWFSLRVPTPRGSRRLRLACVLATAGVALALGSAALRAFYVDPERARGAIELLYLGMGGIALLMIASFAEAALRAPDAQRRSLAALVLAALVPGAGLPAIAIFAFALLGGSLSWTWLLLCLCLLAGALLYTVLAP